MKIRSEGATVIDSESIHHRVPVNLLASCVDIDQLYHRHLPCVIILNPTPSCDQQSISDNPPLVAAFRVLASARNHAAFLFANRQAVGIDRVQVCARQLA